MSDDSFISGYRAGEYGGRLVGFDFVFEELKIIHELVTGDDPYMALQHINESFGGEKRELLIKIFRLEEIALEEEG